MSEVDLIPAQYRDMLLRRRWITLSLIALTVLLCVSVSAYAAVGFVTKRIDADIAQLQEQKAISTQQRDELAGLLDREAELQQQWELLNGLRSGAAAEAMLEMIDRSLSGDDVWFVSLQFRRAGIVVEQAPETVNTGYFIVVPKGAAAKKPESWQIQTHMTITGQSRDHAALSGFVKRLFQQPEVDDVRVMKTALRRYTTTRVVDYDLAIVVNSSVEAH